MADENGIATDERPRHPDGKFVTTPGKEAGGRSVDNAQTLASMMIDAGLERTSEKILRVYRQLFHRAVEAADEKGDVASFRGIKTMFQEYMNEINDYAPAKVAEETEKASAEVKAKNMKLVSKNIRLMQALKAAKDQGFEVPDFGDDG